MNIQLPQVRSKATAYGEADAPVLRSQRTGGKWTMWSAKHEVNLLTLNIRTLNKPGKLKLVEEELNRIKWDIVGLAETHWPGEGEIMMKDGKIFYSGRNDKIHREGVAIVIKKWLVKSVIEICPCGPRIISITLRGKEKGVKIKIIQVYAPDISHEENEVESFYNSLQIQINKTQKNEILMIIGDFNAKIGRFSEDMREVMGKFGVDQRNERGERLLEYCKENNLFVSNTLFYHKPKNKYTWTSPDGFTRNCIDYILINRQWKSSIRNVKTLRSTDFDTDHEILAAQVKWRFRKTEPKNNKKLLNIERLQQMEVQKDFEDALKSELQDVEMASVDEAWEEGKKIINKVAHNVLGYRPKINHDWITDEIMEAWKQKRVLKNALNINNTKENRENYKKSKNKIDRMCKLAKIEWLKKKSETCEEANRRHDTKTIYRTIKEITKPFTSKGITLKDKNDIKTGDIEKIKQIWKSHFENIFKEEEEQHGNNISEITKVEDTAQIILKEEVKVAIDQMKLNKSPGIDDIQTELWKYGGEIVINYLTQLFNNVLFKGDIPKDWTTGIIVPIFKKGDKSKCENYRPITLLCHSYKIFVRVLQNRTHGRYEEILGEEQAGFRVGRSTIDQIFALSLIAEKFWENNRPLYCCFIDYKQAFDSINRYKLLEILKAHGFSDKESLEFLDKLYKNTTAAVRINSVRGEEFKVSKGVMQGCPYSPNLFNVYLENITQSLENENGIMINGKVVNHIKYADDVVIIAETKEQLQKLVDMVDEMGKKYDMRINHSKTKIMRIGRGEEEFSVKIEDKNLEQVQSFVYLGTTFTQNLNSLETIKHRISIAWTNMNSLNKIWKAKDISKELKLKLYETIIIPTAIYGAEAWKMNEKEKQRLLAFEMKCLRKINGTIWSDYKTNVKVREELGYRKLITNSCVKRQLQWFGHVVRQHTERIPNLALYGRIGGKRPRGRPRRTWIEALKINAGFTTIREMTELARKRDEWRLRTTRGLNPS